MIKIIYPMYAGFPSKMANVNQRINTCYALAATGRAEVHIVYPSSKKHTLAEILSDYDLQMITGIFLHPVGLSHNYWKLGFLLRIYSRLGLAFSTARLILLNKENAILFGRDIEYLSMFLYLAKITHCPVVYESHGISSAVLSEYPMLLGKKSPKNMFSRWIYSLQERRILKKADAVICTTNSLKHILSTEFAIEEEKLFVIPNGASDISTMDSGCHSDVLEEFTKSDFIRILYTGQFYPWKGVDLIIKSAVYLPEHYRIYLVGGNNKIDNNRLIQYARECGVSDRIVFMGQVKYPEARKLQRSAHVLVLSLAPGNVESDKFTSPIKIFEYMASNKPIIAPNLPMIREVLEHGRNAWLYEANDPENLAKAIKFIASTPEIARKISSRARAEFLDKHTWEKRAFRLMEIMESVF